KILNEQILLYRNEAGEMVATSNTCPHRFAPLHLGKVVDGTIECPYHGLRFNGEGRCVYNPDGDGRIPAGARLKSYPITERLGAAWIWMGDPAKVDLAMIPDFEFLDDPAYRTVKGVLHVRANYRYINDNLMGEAHLHMVHHDSLACDMVRRFNVDKAILSVSSVDLNRSLLCTLLPQVGSVQQAMIDIAQTVIVVADNSKFDRTALCVIAPLSEVDYIVTDTGTAPAAEELPDDIKRKFVFA
ncbi:MAG: Rieske 2Fe-2S domain-containing protein, partial [Proteobacteria bacterium]|nr:Rieske 2Fe-2S domain-containing protein [Pseudomonadota bacterium]